MKKPILNLPYTVFATFINAYCDNEFQLVSTLLIVSE